MESSLFPIDSPRRRPSIIGGMESEYGLLGQGCGNPEVHPGNAPAGAGRVSQPATPARHHSHRKYHHPVAAAAIAFLLIPSIAFAQSPNQKAETEARSFFLPCAKVDKICAEQQKDFTNSYVLARLGLTFFMTEVSRMLSPSVPATVGIRSDPLEACAWEYFRWKVSKNPKIATVYENVWAANCASNTSLARSEQAAHIEALRKRLLAPPPPVLTPALAELAKLQDFDATIAALVQKSRTDGP